MLLVAALWFRVILIDAFNVLYAAPKVEPRLAGLTLSGLIGLLEQVGSGGVGSGAGATVLVIDGTGGGGGGIDERYTRPDAPVRVVFAGPGKDADSVIERMLEDLHFKSIREGKGGRGLPWVTVVSSDRRVQAAAVGAVCKRESAEAFVRLLVQGAHRAAARGRTNEAAAGRDITPEAQAYWLKQFGLVPRSQEASPKSTPAPSAAKPKGQEPEKPRDEFEGIDPAELDMRKWLGEGG